MGPCSIHQAAMRGRRAAGRLAPGAAGPRRWCSRATGPVSFRLPRGHPGGGGSGGSVLKRRTLPFPSAPPREDCVLQARLEETRPPESLPPGRSADASLTHMFRIPLPRVTWSREQCGAETTCAVPEVACPGPLLTTVLMACCPATRVLSTAARLGRTDASHLRGCSAWC